jgi:hypothetical protein
MKFLVHINRVSEFFFLLIGGVYILSFLSWRNDFYPLETEIYLRLADLPIAFFGILYAFTSLRLSLTIKNKNEDDDTEDEMEDELHHKSKFPVLDILLLLIAIAIFTSVVYVDIFIPNTFPFPKPL